MIMGTLDDALGIIRLIVILIFDIETDLLQLAREPRS